MSLFTSLIGAGIGAAGSIYGAKKGTESTLEAARLNAKMQEKFAKHGVRWKVQDAKAAGIHPLAALGMSPTQATPVHVGANPGRGVEAAANKMSDALMQQQVELGDLDIERKRYENMLLDAQISRERAEYEKSFFESEALRKEFGKGKKGTITNPRKAFEYAIDQYTGKLIAHPIQELSEVERPIGSKLFYYGNIRQHGRNVFDFFEGPPRRR